MTCRKARGAALEFAALLLMDELKPSERAAYVLREAFEYRYDEIANILRSNEQAVRQLISRARKRMATWPHWSGSSRRT